MGINELDPHTLHRCQCGEMAALGVLYDAYRQPLYYLAQRMVGHRDAEDVCQEIFIALFRNLESFRGRSKFSTWVLALGTRVCLMHLRKHRAATTLTEPLETAGTEPADTLSPGLELATKDFWQQLATAIDALPTTQRAAIVLRSLDEMSYEEIARALELSVEQVRATLFRARQNLIARLKEECRHG